MHVIILPQVKVAIDYILKHRRSKSRYVFATKSGARIDGCATMKELSEECPGLTKPQLIRSRLLRKYIATTTQLLDLNDSEMKLVADHLGHSLQIHSDIYTLQSSILEKTKVARILIGVEQGIFRQSADKRLASMDADSLPVPVDYADDWTSKKDEDDAGNQEGAVTPNQHLEDEGAVSPNHDSEDERADTSSTSSMSKQHTKWNKELNAAFRMAFGTQIKQKRNITAGEIRKALQDFPCLNVKSEAILH